MDRQPMPSNLIVSEESKRISFVDKLSDLLEKHPHLIRENPHAANSILCMLRIPGIKLMNHESIWVGIGGTVGEGLHMGYRDGILWLAGMVNGTWLIVRVIFPGVGNGFLVLSYSYFASQTSPEHIRLKFNSKLVDSNGRSCIVMCDHALKRLINAIVHDFDRCVDRNKNSLDVNYIFGGGSCNIEDALSEISHPWSENVSTSNVHGWSHEDDPICTINQIVVYDATNLNEYPSIGSSVKKKAKKSTAGGGKKKTTNRKQNKNVPKPVSPDNSPPLGNKC